MNSAERSHYCEEVDAFILSQKSLIDCKPRWENASRPNELGFKWWIIEEDGTSDQAYLTFLHRPGSQAERSVSLIYRKYQVCRIDLLPEEIREGNPPEALMMGLPSAVFGSHIHLWEHNKAYVLDSRQKKWEIPVKVEISNSIQSYGELLVCICYNCGIDFTQTQRDMVP